MPRGRDGSGSGPRRPTGQRPSPARAGDPSRTAVAPTGRDGGQPTRGPVVPGTAGARDTLARAGRLHRDAVRLIEADARLLEEVRQGYAALRAQAIRQKVGGMPVTRLRDAGGQRLRIAALQDAGIVTVGDVLDTPASRLAALPGLGEATARQVITAARAVADAVAGGVRVRVDLDRSSAAATRLLRALYRYAAAGPELSRAREAAAGLRAQLGPALAAAGPARGRVRLLLAGRRRAGDAAGALDRTAGMLRRAQDTGAADLVAAVAKRLAVRVTTGRAWRDFERRSAEYYALLSELAGLGPPVEAVEGFLPADIVRRVRRQPLDDTYRRVRLRGYQSFGARFALAQRRVVLGDEMGLGKTIQAIAVLAHLRAAGERHFLVVCPASVLVNWLREVRERSLLPAYRLHGPGRAVAVREWCRDGGVGVTTVDSLHDLAVPPGLVVGALVLDEAHYVKNPGARRSRAVRAWTGRVDRVLFLSGTPMENRVAEFRNLVEYLRPGQPAGVSGEEAVAGAMAFRRAVAPVYLRRNQDDVLGELPDLVRADEWVEFSPADAEAYRRAVVAGNFMAMRRAGYAVADPARSAKLHRLRELVDEAAGNGRHVVVFSYFREVCDTVCRMLGSRAYGPLTGSVRAEQRQELVDAFARARRPAVLVSQIQAGGVGLNIQAASVVIICEPQVKPTIEEQAIARSRRMGQVRGVQVHRLLTPDSVDQRMLEILDGKTKLFDEYARRSEVAAASPDALDAGHTDLGRQVVALERRRLALDRS